MKARTAILALVCGAYAPAAAADPVELSGVVTGGTWFMVASNPVMAGWTFRAQAADGTVFWPGSETIAPASSLFFGLCRPCVAGDSFSPSGSVHGNDLGQGTVSVGSLDNPTFYRSRTRWTGGFEFTAESTVLPQEAGDLFWVSLPFTFVGNLSGWASPDRDRPEDLEVNVNALNGSGSASVQFRTQAHPVFGRMFTPIAVGFSFSDPHAPAPVPEPASVFLLGGGLGLAALRSRRRKGCRPA
jgi:hypothetical protein